MDEGMEWNGEAGLCCVEERKALSCNVCYVGEEEELCCVE